MSLQEMFVLDIYAFFMVFGRVGGAFLFMIGFAATSVPMQARLVLALLISLVLTPLVSPLLPPEPLQPAVFALNMGKEILIGMYFGLFTQVMISSLQSAGMLIAMQTGLANAFVSDPDLSSQSSVFGRVLVQMGLIIIFVTGLDHLMLQALFESYTLFPPGQPLMTGDMAEFFARAINQSYGMAVQLAGPFIVVSLVFQTGMGLLAKLVPTIQIFFIAMPAQVLGGLVLFAFTIPAILLTFSSYFENQLENYLIP